MRPYMPLTLLAALSVVLHLASQAQPAPVPPRTVSVKDLSRLLGTGPGHEVIDHGTGSARGGQGRCWSTT